MAKGFQKKSDRQIFVGYSNDRKGWLCFDTKTFRVTTSIHLTFDENFNNRRNALISYDKHLEAGVRLWRIPISHITSSRITDI